MGEAARRGDAAIERLVTDVEASKRLTIGERVGQAVADPEVYRETKWLD